MTAFRKHATLILMGGWRLTVKGSVGLLVIHPILRLHSFLLDMGVPAFSIFLSTYFTILVTALDITTVYILEPQLAWKLFAVAGSGTLGMESAFARIRLALFG
jgi:hypothetical protein